MWAPRWALPEWELKAQMSWPASFCLQCEFKKKNTQLFYNVDGIINYGRHGSQFWTLSSGEYSGEAAPSLMKAETSKQHQCYGYSISEMRQAPQIVTFQLEQSAPIVLFYFPI